MRPRAIEVLYQLNTGAFIKVLIYYTAENSKMYEVKHHREVLDQCRTDLPLTVESCNSIAEHYKTLKFVP